MTSILKDRREEDIDRGRRSCEDGGSDYSDAAILPRTPGAFIIWKRQGKIFP